MRSECFEDVVRSDDGDESSSDDLSPEERAYVEGAEPSSSGTMAKHGEEIDENYPTLKEENLDHEEIKSEADDGDEGENIDDRSNYQLWQRLRNDVVQNPSYEGMSPVELQPIFKRWIHASGARASESSRYRFFIIIDSEVIQNLLRVSLPLGECFEDWEMYSVKVFDAEFNPRRVGLRNPESYSAKLVTRLSKDEGWFWAAGWRLGYLFFQERAEDRESVRTFDDQDRPLHRGATY